MMDQIFLFEKQFHDLTVVRFGGDDETFKFFLPTKKTGIFTVWGTGLVDKSGTKVEKDRKKWEYDQDMEHQDVKQYMEAAGIGHELNLDKSAFLSYFLRPSGEFSYFCNRL